MQRRSSLLLGAVVVGCGWLVGCTDSSPVAPDVRVALDLAGAADAPDDSGEVVVYPSDGPGGTTALRAMMATSAAGPQIRIGVVQTATQVTLGSAADYVLRDKANGLTLLTGSGGGTVTVTLAQVAASHYRLQVMCASTAAVEARKAAAEALGHPTFTAFNAGANCTRLYIGQFDPPPANTFAARTAYKNLLVEQGLAQADAFWVVVTIGGGTVYRAVRGGDVVESVNPVVLESSDGIVTIGGMNDGVAIPARKYRGVGEARQSGAALAGINELPVEHYLYGVVPRELGPVQYPEIEAQKAQAVAARTYALEGIRTNKRGIDGYHLRATTDDQVYGGLEAEHPVSTQAVDATAGLAATVGGQYISALFHSTSGGHTADNEEAFQGAPAAYLRGVPDAERGQALAHVPSLEVFRAHPNPQSLRAARQGDFESDWARLHRWTYEWTMEEISASISAFEQRPVGRVLAINVLQRGPSGRVTEIEYVTESGPVTVSRDRIRASLRYLDASGTPANLPSTLFFIEPVREPATKALVGYRVYGGGFGHGVGLSQTGAVGMAQKGHSFEEILGHYYRGIAVEAQY